MAYTKIVDDFSSRENTISFRQGIKCRKLDCEKNMETIARDKLSDCLVEYLLVNGYNLKDIKLYKSSFDYGFIEGFAFSADLVRDKNDDPTLKVIEYLFKKLSTAKDFSRYLRRARSADRIKKRFANYYI